MMAIAIVLCVLVLVVGNLMSAKPKAIELWQDKVRMIARTLGLNPKLVPYPNWLPKDNTKKTQGMIAQYGVLDDDWQLPQAFFVAMDGVWHKQDVPKDTRTSRSSLAKKADRLDGLPMDLPMFEPYFLGLVIWANSIVIIWHDDKYAQACVSMQHDEAMISAQLTTLAERLYAWGAMANA